MDLSVDRHDIVHDRSDDAESEAPKGSPSSRASKKHTKQKSRKQGCIEERKDELHVVHDRGKARDQISSHDADQNTYTGGQTPHPEIVSVALVFGDIALVDIKGPDGIKCGDITSHARHKAGQ